MHTDRILNPDTPAWILISTLGATIIWGVFFRILKSKETRIHLMFITKTKQNKPQGHILRDSKSQVWYVTGAMHVTMRWRTYSKINNQRWFQTNFTKLQWNYSETKSAFFMSIITGKWISHKIENPLFRRTASTRCLQDMVAFLHFWPLCAGNPFGTGGFPNGTVMRSFRVFSTSCWTNSQVADYLRGHNARLLIMTS